MYVYCFSLNYVLKDCILSLVWPLMSLSFISLIIRRLFDGYFLKYLKQKVFANWLYIRALLQYLSKLFRSLSFYLLLVQSLKVSQRRKLSSSSFFFFFWACAVLDYLVEVEAFQSSYFSHASPSQTSDLSTSWKTLPQVSMISTYAFK